MRTLIVRVISSCCNKTAIPGGLTNNSRLFLKVLEAGQPEAMAPAGPASGEATAGSLLEGTLRGHYRDANPNLPLKAPPPGAIAGGVRMSTNLVSSREPQAFRQGPPLPSFRRQLGWGRWWLRSRVHSELSCLPRHAQTPAAQKSVHRGPSPGASHWVMGGRNVITVHSV